MVFLYHPTSRAGVSAIMALLTLAVFIVLGCNSGPGPTAPPADPWITQQNDTTGSTRMLWGLYNFYVNEDHTEVRVEPRRNAQFHFNAVGLIDLIDPANLTVDSWSLEPDGTIKANIKVIHPMDSDLTIYTGFDVRGIVMFPSVNTFPEFDITTPGVYPGEAAFLNPDGYTRRWNSVEYSEFNKPFSYIDGSMIKSGTGNLCTTTVNPYRTFHNDLNRRYFKPGTDETLEYHLSFPPGPMVFAYALDASWGLVLKVDTNPDGQPQFIPGSFPNTCNSVEPYQITLIETIGNLECSLAEYAGGSTSLSVVVNDWQGDAEVFLGAISIEAPDLFDGTVDHYKKDNGEYHTYYRFQVPNTKQVLPGFYPAMLAIELDQNNDPFWQIDTPLTAYQMFMLEVVEVSPPFCQSMNTIHNVGPGIYGISDTYGAVHNDASFLPKISAPEGQLLFDGGIFGYIEHIQFADIPGGGGATTAYTMILRVGADAGNATILQGNEYNGHLLIVTDADLDNLLVYDTMGDLLREYDLGSGTYEPVLLTTDPENGDIWLVGHNDDGEIKLERMGYAGSGENFEYTMDFSATIDLGQYMGDDPRPLGLALNTHLNLLYYFHADNEGSVEAFDISEIPPVHNANYSRAGVIGAPIQPTAVPGSRRLIGGEILVDYVDTGVASRCRVLAFANTSDGASRLTRLDGWCQTLATEQFSFPYSCAALNNPTAVTERDLILFPLNSSENYSIYLAPVGW